MFLVLYLIPDENSGGEGTDDEKAKGEGLHLGLSPKMKNTTARISRAKVTSEAKSLIWFRQCYRRSPGNEARYAH